MGRQKRQNKKEIGARLSPGAHETLPSTTGAERRRLPIKRGITLSEHVL
jgi:hypothetical protein